MSARDYLRATLRFWYVVVLGAALSVGALYLIRAQEPVYWTQFDVVLVDPPGRDGASVMDHPVYGLEPLTGVVATRFNHGRSPHPTGDVSASMIGQGRLDGVEVRVPNLGTQWRTNFSANYLDVQVAGATPEAVSAAAVEASAELSRLLESEQASLGVPVRLRATAVPSSDDPRVVPVTGSRTRAAAATALVGASLTGMVVYWLEVWRRRRVEALTLPAGTYP